ncbi:response regulator [Dyella flagellata]|uniref:histidine kinase n=2 Tax=Dyella flagellata TaxID=1867833 RepID=A0ABQ5XH01_9GAMM|nr:hybrid sensor histidine kinase/response regulator [Dyella flagellata]GLQ90474.1 histidine kinase [Dyella flagellata]
MLGLAFLLGAVAPGGTVSATSAANAPAPTAVAHASEAAPLPTPQFRRYGVQDGLPSSVVYAVAQDHDGAMWFGTKGGIARFDGLHFHVFRHIENDPDSLYGNEISALFVDRQGILWAGGLGPGLNRYDPATGKFTHWGHDPANPQSLAHDHVWVIAQTPDGSIWVGTGEGLDRMRPDGQGFEHVINPLIGLYPSDFGIVYALYTDPKGRLWVSCDRGTFRRDLDGSFVRIKSADPNQSLDAWRIDGNGDEVRIATGQGLLEVGPDDVARLFGAPSIPHQTNVMTSTRDAAGHLWVGTQRGMYLQMSPDAPVVQLVNQPLLHGNLPGTWVWQTLVDREGGLWVTTFDGGVAYLAPGWNRFSRYTHIPDDPTSLRDSVATSMARGRDGRHVWVGERDGRIDRLDPVTGKVEHVLDGLSERVLGMTEDFRQRLWIIPQGSLYRYDYVRGRLDQVDPQHRVLDRPLEVEPGPDGQMYARTFGHGIFRIDPDTLAVSPVAMDKPNEKVMWGSQMTLYKGTFWYASDGGLMWFDRGSDRFVMVPGIPSGKAIDAFDFDRTGIWVATEDGLSHYHFDGRRLALDRTVDAEHGWPSLRAVDLDVDCLGRIWIFSIEGLWRYDPARSSFYQVGLQNGLANGEFDRGYALLPSGYLYAATNGGVVGFDPDKVDPPPMPSALSVTQITVQRKGVTRNLALTPQPIRVSWRDSQLHIQARLFSYINPSANQYRFRLNGFDSDWVDRDNHGEREFTGLGSGDYTLDVMARSSEGRWVQLVAPLHIVVQAPPWLRWWAWLLYVIVSVALGFLVLLAWRRRLAHRRRIQFAEQRHQIAEQASAAKSRFLATLSHEIRTPMTGMMGMSELLLATPLNDSQREYAESMQRSSNLLLKLLNDALDLARIEAGKLVLDPAPFELRPMLQDAVRLQKGAAQAKGLVLELHVSEEVPALLVGDGLRIRQVLFNLVSNAVKFTERGGIRIDVGWTDGSMSLDVSDTGPGISETSRVRLFRRFEQDDGPQRSIGSGLGLAICNELVGLMGGHMTLESMLGKGSTFHVRLPLQVAQETAQDEIGRAGRPCALNVLLVDGDVTAAHAVRDMLQQLGHRVRHANHGLNALAELALEPCDVMLLELDLPGIDGFQVAQLIRHGEVVGGHVPIVAITTRGDEEEMAHGRQVGIDAFLHKPVIGAQTAAAMQEAMTARAAAPKKMNLV